MVEIWKDIKGYEGLYQVSNLGMVRSLDRLSTGRKRMKLKGVVLCFSMYVTGYYKVELCKNGKVKHFRVHRLVAFAFLQPVPGKEVINHRDNNPLNNCYSNLEWCTQGENVQHAYDIGARKPKRKLTEAQAEFVKEFYKFRSPTNSIPRIAEQLGVADHLVRCEIRYPRKHSEAQEVI